MAKRQRHNQVSASFHYLIKVQPDKSSPDGVCDIPFTKDEFQRIVSRISNTSHIDDNNEEIIKQIKLGNEMPFKYYELFENTIHFGEFEGAYYGQEYRNNRLGMIGADTLNLRIFHYVVTLLRDGKILIGVTYNGQYGDYSGLKSCFLFQLGMNSGVASRTIRSMSDELGRGEPVEVKLTYRKASERPERRSLFGRSGVIAIKASEYGDDFGEKVETMARNAKGDTEARRRSIAQMVSDGGMVELDDGDIIGCSAIIRENGSTRTVYFVGENNFSTRYPLAVRIDLNGRADRENVKNEMIRVMREKIIPLLAS